MDAKIELDFIFFRRYTVHQTQITHEHTPTAETHRVALQITNDYAAKTQHAEGEELIGGEKKRN